MCLACNVILNIIIPYCRTRPPGGACFLYIYSCLPLRNSRVLARVGFSPKYLALFLPPSFRHIAEPVRQTLYTFVIKSLLYQSNLSLFHVFKHGVFFINKPRVWICGYFVLWSSYKSIFCPILSGPTHCWIVKLNSVLWSDSDAV